MRTLRMIILGGIIAVLESNLGVIRRIAAILGRIVVVLRRIAQMSVIGLQVPSPLSLLVSRTGDSPGHRALFIIDPFLSRH